MIEQAAHGAEQARADIDKQAALAQAEMLKAYSTDQKRRAGGRKGHTGNCPN